MLFLEIGKLTEAEEHFRSVLRINPEDAIASFNLDLVRQARASHK